MDVKPTGHRKSIVIVTPIFNDWVAFAMVLKQLGALPELGQYELRLIIIDDSSSEMANLADLMNSKGSIIDVQIIRLACNLGHQRAIAVGLVAACKIANADAVVVMDSDGEDLPTDVPRLIKVWREHPEQIVVAKRRRRTEGSIFRICYSFYKVIFWILTAETIDFGNFSILPRHAVEALIHDPAIWNNMAAAISKSCIPYSRIPMDRGERLAGHSRMNFLSLALYGMSAISVYAEVVLVRVVAMACIFSVLVLAGVAAIVAIRLTTGWVMPEWASYVAASSIAIFFLAIVLGGLAMFQLLSFRSLKPFVPALDAEDFILQQPYKPVIDSERKGDSSRESIAS